MHWRLKAAIQNAVAALPRGIGYEVYYQLQRRLAGLRDANPVSRLQAGVAIVERLQRLGFTIAGAAVLEVGTGRRLNLPMALWACGAQRIVTVDLNPYLRPELVFEDLRYMREHAEEIRTVFATLPGARGILDRLERLLTWRGARLPDLLELLDITYVAPGDARRMEAASASFDLHVSFTVLEHIPPGVLGEIFQEGRRLLRPTGRFVHNIDFTDHFAHSDSRITTVNFLQFSEAAWARMAGNRFMYHNRLRVDEFRALVDAAGLEIIQYDLQSDARAEAVLAAGELPLDARFRGKPPGVNATARAWLVAGPGTPAASRSPVGR